MGLSVARFCPFLDLMLFILTCNVIGAENFISVAILPQVKSSQSAMGKNI
jgi:hypothetical protein